MSFLSTSSTKTMVATEIPEILPSLAFRAKVGAPGSDGPKRDIGVKAFVNGIVSPFTNCWQPHFDPCSSGCSDSRFGCFDGSPAIVSPKRASSFEISKSPDRDAASSPINSEGGNEHSSDIQKPHQNDVLCGRGGSSNRHVGNMQFRELVAANKKTYVGLTKKQKMMVARQIVDMVRQTKPPGRFLAKDSDTGMWYDIGLPRSLEKTSQALREKNSNDLPDLAHGESSIAELHVSDEKGNEEARSKNSKTKKVETPQLTIPPHLMDVFCPKPSSQGASSQWPRLKPSFKQIEQPYLRSPYPSHAATSSQGYGVPPISPHVDSPRSPHYSGSPRYGNHDSPKQDYREHYDYHKDQYFRQARHGMPHPSHPGYRSYSHAPHPSYNAMPMSRRLQRPGSRQTTSLGQNGYGYPPSSPPQVIPIANSTHPIIYRTPSNGYVRGKSEVSPERRQEWKRQRNENGTLRRFSETSLSKAVKDSLSLEDRTDRHQRPEANITSPSGLMQGRSQRISQKDEKDKDQKNGGLDMLTGLAALSTAALFKLEGKPRSN